MANLIPKVSAQKWLETARKTLILEGIAALKIDRLARELGVSRGGFYHHFVDRDDLLERLLREWHQTVIFVPCQSPMPSNPAEALWAIDSLVTRLIREDGYDPLFDMAVRAWSHSDLRVTKAVERSDKSRISTITGYFAALGCNATEAAVRARVFYFHQIGYYAIGLKEARKLREKRAIVYVQILCGEIHLQEARNWAKRNKISVTSAPI
ncbi:MAG: TetR/AcrR family transcriptional regulator [Comamonadaceae bacterium]